MMHVYYMVFEHWSRSAKLGNSWNELSFDSPITSIKDIRDAAEFEKKRQQKRPEWKGSEIFQTMVQFYSFLRTEEETKDMSKFEVGDK